MMSGWIWLALLMCPLMMIPMFYIMMKGNKSDHNNQNHNNTAHLKQEMEELRKQNEMMLNEIHNIKKTP